MDHQFSFWMVWFLKTKPKYVLSRYICATTSKFLFLQPERERAIKNVQIYIFLQKSIASAKRPHLLVQYNTAMPIPFK